MTRIRQRPPKIKRARGQDVEQAIARVITASTADREIPVKKRKVKDLPGSRSDDNDDAVIPEHLTNEDMEKQVAFCCCRCFCPEEDKNQIPVDDPFIQEGEARLYHRRCCHKVYHPDPDWMSPYQKAIENLEVEGGEEPIEEMTVRDFLAQYNNALHNENALYNCDTLPSRFLCHVSYPHMSDFAPFGIRSQLPLNFLFPLATTLRLWKFVANL